MPETLSPTVSLAVFDKHTSDWVIVGMFASEPEANAAIATMRPGRIKRAMRDGCQVIPWARDHVVSSL